MDLPQKDQRRITYSILSQIQKNLGYDYNGEINQISPSNYENLENLEWPLARTHSLK